MEEHEVAAALSSLTAQLVAHAQDGTARTKEVVRRLDSINGYISENSRSIAVNREQILVLRNRWIMLGWVAGALATAVTLTVAVIALLQTG